MFSFVGIKNDVYEDCLMKWENATNSKIGYIIMNME